MRLGRYGNYSHSLPLSGNFHAEDRRRNSPTERRSHGSFAIRSRVVRRIVQESCASGSRARPTGPFTLRSAERLWKHRSRAIGIRPPGCGRERGNRPNATKRAAGRDRESTRFEQWARRRAAGAPTGKRSRTARQEVRRPARSSSRPGNDTQSTNLRNWSVRNSGRDQPTHRRRRRSGNSSPVPCGTGQHRTIAHRGSNAPQPNDRAAHGSPSWPANSRQATKQRKSALSQPSSTLEPAVRRVVGETHPPFEETESYYYTMRRRK
jgi:hypothetical protein